MTPSTVWMSATTISTIRHFRRSSPQGGVVMHRVLTDTSPSALPAGVKREPPNEAFFATMSEDESSRGRFLL